MHSLTESSNSISVGLITWIEDNDQLPELKRCLDSLTDFYPVIVVNGKWNDFKGKNPRSTDEANELIGSYSNVIHIQSPDKPEWYNRNLAIDTANKMGYNILFWVDSDEWVEMPLGLDFFTKSIDFQDKHTCYMHYYDDGKGGNCRMIRLIKDLDKVKINKKHNEWLIDNTNIFKDPAPAPRGITIYSDNKYRSEDRKIRMKQRNKYNPVH